MTGVPTPAADAARTILRTRIRAAAAAMLGVLVRHMLTAIGTALVTRGLVDKGTVDGIIPMAVEEIVGALIVGAAIGWGQLRAYASHTRWAAAWAALRAETPPPAGAGPAQP
jgi:hypothetical protein